MIRINLLPRAPRRRLPAQRVLELVLPAAVLVAVVVWTLMLGARVGARRAELDRLDREVAALRPTVARVEELDRQIGALRRKESLLAELLKQQLPAASILNEVRLLIPRDVWLTAMSVPEEGTLNLEGFGMTHYAVAQLMDNLALGQLFRAVDLTVVQLERVGAAEVVRFQVNARVLRPQATTEGVRQ